MKTLLVFTTLVIAAVSVFGQQRLTPAPAQQMQQPARTENYQQPAQQPERTQNYQQPTQQTERIEPAQQSAQQPTRTENYEQPKQQLQKAGTTKQQITSAKTAVKEDKKSTRKDEDRNKYAKDSLVLRQGLSHTESEQTKPSKVQHWRCPKCGRAFIALPANGRCPDDDTPLVQDVY
jgi:rubrerythrin